MKYRKYIIAAAIVVVIAIAQNFGNPFSSISLPWFVWALAGIGILAVLKK